MSFTDRFGRRFLWGRGPGTILREGSGSKTFWKRRFGIDLPQWFRAKVLWK